MNKRTIGYLITALIVGAMVVLMIKTNVEKTEPITATNNVLAADTGMEKGNFPPDFELETLSGDTVKLSDLKGKKVMLNFWASWCGPCKAEMPHMEKYYKKNKESENFEIIAVNLTKQERKGLDSVEQFVDAHKLTFPIPLDKDGKVMDEYQVLSIPTTFMLNTDGTIEHKIIAPMDEKMLKDIVMNLN